MDWQTMFNGAFALLAAILGWFARTLWGVMMELKSELAKLREEVANNRVHKDDLREALREVKASIATSMRDVNEMLGRIFDRLDSKEDKR